MICLHDWVETHCELSLRCQQRLVVIARQVYDLGSLVLLYCLQVCQFDSCHLIGQFSRAPHDIHGEGASVGRSKSVVDSVTIHHFGVRGQVTTNMKHIRVL